MKKFPDQDEFYKTIIHQDDKVFPGKVAEIPLHKYYNYYRDKRNIAAKFEPTKIAEIGVRYGYSAWAFTMGSDELKIYHGYDNGSYIGNQQEYMKQLLSPFDLDEIKFFFVNTQRISSMYDIYDFIHVDGDHSYKGAMHDMEICWPATTKVMLIDDYDFIKSVKLAVDDFIKAHINEIETVQYFKTFRGDMAIIKKEGVQ